ncbi:miraculin [Lactuca sativa]|uniref:miraculin n=1 Tax=Lactuca sativa TaxID=4236 RepID=UPI000CABD922|nr:miraculin [Lactuca sativa]
MKSSLSDALFLLFFITTQSICYITTNAAGENVVKDATGKKVLNGVPYHIGPVISANGGRIKLTDTMNNNKICPFNVVQDPADVNLGGQFMFTLIAKKKYLLTSTILAIDSGYPKGACEKSTFWTIPNVLEPPPSSLITTGGLFDQSFTCFQVVEYPKSTSPKVHSYMLQHCPSFCGAGPGTCFNVSIYLDKGVRRLAATGDTPFEFVFHKLSK